MCDYNQIFNIVKQLY